MPYQRVSFPVSAQARRSARSSGSSLLPMANRVRPDGHGGYVVRRRPGALAWLGAMATWGLVVGLAVGINHQAG